MTDLLRKGLRWCFSDVLGCHAEDTSAVAQVVVTDIRTLP